MGSYLSSDGADLGQILLFGEQLLALKENGRGLLIWDAHTRGTIHGRRLLADRAQSCRTRSHFTRPLPQQSCCIPPHTLTRSFLAVNRASFSSGTTGHGELLCGVWLTIQLACSYVYTSQTRLPITDYRSRPVPGHRRCRCGVPRWNYQACRYPPRRPGHAGQDGGGGGHRVGVPYG